VIPHQAPGTRHALGTKHQAPGTCASVALLVALAALAACGPSPEQQRLRDTTKATYDKATGRLERLTYDANKDGVIDTWTYMDGTKVLRSEIDKNQDGRIDRWEYYGDDGTTVVKVAISKADNGKPDTWLYPGPDGQAARAEISTRSDGKIDRWEWYDHGALVRSEEDDNGDGKPDKWETYANGAIVTVAFDENHDGRPDRRLTYGPGGKLVSIETEPDANGHFTKKIAVKQ
jgi:antitoxin component YwqK of YwqJK toxin-antitoxin module